MRHYTSGDPDNEWNCILKLSCIQHYPFITHEQFHSLIFPQEYSITPIIVKKNELENSILDEIEQILMFAWRWCPCNFNGERFKM